MDVYKLPIHCIHIDSIFVVWACGYFSCEVRHLNNIHGTMRDACKENEFAFHRQRGILCGDMTGDKDLHDVSERVFVDEFDKKHHGET